MKFTVEYHCHRRQGAPERMLSAVFVAVAAYAILLTLLPVRPALASPPPGYRLIWSDEFNGALGQPPDASKWHHETGGGGWGNNELETYVDRADNAHIVADPDATDHRALAIIATSGGNGHYYSTRLDSLGLGDFTDGFVEARIKIPDAKGTWPAFWMLGDNIGQVGWPKCGEMDIMEHIGQPHWGGMIRASLHSQAASGVTQIHADYHLPAAQKFSSGYHLFQMLRMHNLVSYYVDGNLFETHTAADIKDGDWPFDNPSYFILNLAIGGDWPGRPDQTTVFPQTMLIDYVRAYAGAATRLDTPGNVQVSPGPDGGQILLSWPGEVGVTSYSICRKQFGAAGAPALIASGVNATNYLDTNTNAGVKYAYRVTAASGDKSSRPSRTVLATASIRIETPYGGQAWEIPGRIQCADYDNGGEGTAYHCRDKVNQGGEYRLSEGVGIESCADPGNPYDVGYSADGDWLKYTVDVTTSGTYTLRIRVSNGSGAPGAFHIEDAAGNNITGPIIVAPGTGWQDWKTISAQVRLKSGRQTICVFDDHAGFNLASMTFARA